MGLKIHRWKHSGNMPNSSVQSEEINPPPCQKKKNYYYNLNKSVWQ